MAIAVVDYCKGNLRSVQRGVESVGGSAFISSDVAEISQAEALILPGVGSFADAAETMVSLGQMELLRDMIADGVPFLGICLGLHLLFERGEEGAEPGGFIEGLGVLKGTVRRLPATAPDGAKLKIPHVGWNSVVPAEGAAGPCPILDGIPAGTHFYFTHSYAAYPDDPSDVVATTDHGEDFCCAVRRGNVFGVQFHPEKSSAPGMRVLANFVRLVRRRQMRSAGGCI